ncbi:MAG TPA: thioredoxin fold domain-containing protein [Casimicrobiaceae bacterium]|nr:thioredoxin fold domain-containing protein [Casimicrobiaceae bacterium]
MLRPLPARAWLAATVVALIASASPLLARAQAADPRATDVPPWFAASFLDFRDEVGEAARAGKRVMVYVGQEGCPYCAKLMSANFSQRAIVERTQSHFVAIALDLWGDRETVWVDGAAAPEKELARRLDVSFTPTLLFLDERGRIVVRLDGYWPPARFDAVLRYVAAKREAIEPLADWLARNVAEPNRPARAAEPFLMSAPFDFSHRTGGRPLAVIFESPDCDACDEMHDEAFRRDDVRAELARFDVAVLPIGGATPVTTPAGRASSARAWARELGIAYTPSVVFFDAAGREVFRIGAYLRPFHFASSFAYVADAGYRDEPSFQRWLRARADRMRGQGKRVELWE